MMQQPAQKKGLFAQKEQPVNDFATITKDISMIARRMRVLEDHYTNLNRKSQVTEQNMINNHKKLVLDNKTTTSDIAELKKEMSDMKTVLQQIIQELKNTARKEELKLLEKYVNLWETVKFVTTSQVEHIVDDALEERGIKSGVSGKS